MPSVEVVRGLNPSTVGAKADRSLIWGAAWSTEPVLGQPGLHKETLSQNLSPPKNK